MTRGRPKQFDDNEVLERAMVVFWLQGYDGTSLDQLVEAMQIPRQSLYRTFTDKRTLFLKALEYYDKHVTSVVIDVLTADGPAIDNLRNLFKTWDRSISSPERMGCMMVNTRAQFTAKDKDVARLLNANQRRVLNAYERTLERAKVEGGISKDIDARSVSRIISATVTGLLSMSRSGLADNFKEDVFSTIAKVTGIKSS